ncbi:MAG TPA: hypothetical protein VH394_00490 [Thermoanaerobaculia bacterium]|nr:hypothetical protein [Thermoanaerobaculia bacterium]
MRALSEHRSGAQDRKPSLHPVHSRFELDLLNQLGHPRFRYASGERCSQQGKRLRTNVSSVA